MMSPSVSFFTEETKFKKEGKDYFALSFPRTQSVTVLEGMVVVGVRQLAAPHPQSGAVATPHPQSGAANDLLPGPQLVEWRSSRLGKSCLPSTQSRCTQELSVSRVANPLSQINSRYQPLHTLWKSDGTTSPGALPDLQWLIFTVNFTELKGA